MFTLNNMKLNRPRKGDVIRDHHYVIAPNTSSIFSRKVTTVKGFTR